MGLPSSSDLLESLDSNPEKGSFFFTIRSANFKDVPSARFYSRTCELSHNGALCRRGAAQDLVSTARVSVKRLLAKRDHCVRLCLQTLLLGNLSQDQLKFCRRCLDRSIQPVAQ